MKLYILIFFYEDSFHAKSILYKTDGFMYKYDSDEMIQPSKITIMHEVQIF